MKKQTSVAEKQYQSFGRDEKEEPVTIKIDNPLKTDKSTLLYDSKYSFSE